MVMLALTTWPLPPELALPCPAPNPISPPGVWFELTLAPATTATAAVTNPARAPRRSGVWVAPVVPTLCAAAVGAGPAVLPPTFDAAPVGAAGLGALCAADDAALLAAGLAALALPVDAVAIGLAAFKVTVEGGAALVSPLRRA